jgi:hypothetical protein
MKGYGGVKVIAPLFLTSALHEGEWLASRTCRVTPREAVLGSLSVGGWVGPVIGLYKQTKQFRGPSPRANYTDRATVACRPS